MDAPPTNPYEPPRTTDLDAKPGDAPVVLALSDEALRELVAAAPWVRWLARVTSVAIALSLITGIADVVRSPAAASMAARLFMVGVTTAISTSILAVVRRYATAADRLRAGDRGAVSQVIAAQAGYFKRIGKILIPVLGLVLIGAFIAIAGVVSR